MKTRIRQSIFQAGKVLTILGILSSVSPLSASTYTWIGATSAWETAGNWSSSDGGSSWPTALDSIAGATSSTSLTPGTHTVANFAYDGATTWNIAGTTTNLTITGTLSRNATGGLLIFRNSNNNGNSSIYNFNAINLGGGFLEIGQYSSSSSAAVPQTTDTTASSILRGAAGAGSSVASTTVSGGSLHLNLTADYSLGLVTLSGGEIDLNENGVATRSANARVATVTGLAGTGGTIQVNSTNYAANTNTTLQISNTANYTSAVALKNGVAGNILSVTKDGTGTQTLTGASTYTGSTTVSAGTLLINGDNSAATGALTVTADGVLGGTGTIGGATTVGGKLSAGDSGIGLLTFSNSLTLSGNAAFTLDGTGTRGVDFTAVSLIGSGAEGAITYGGTLTLTINYAGEIGDQFDLFDFSQFAGDFSSIDFTNAGYAGAFDPSTGILTLTSVPEPASMALLAVAGVVLVQAGRRRSRAVQQ